MGGRTAWTALVLPCPRGNNFKVGKGEVEGAEKLRLVGPVTLRKNGQQKGGCLGGDLASKMRNGIPWKLALLFLPLNKEF